MIVNPKPLRNRLINSSIIVTALVIVVYGFFSFNELQSQQSLLEKENQVLETELSVMIDKFDEAKSTNQDLTEDYLEVKDSIEETVSIVKELKSELAILPKFKKKANTYSTLNKSLNTEKDSLEKINSELVEEQSKVSKELINQKVENKKLIEETEKLKETLKEKEIVSKNSLKANAMSASFLGKKTITKRASKAKIIEVNFSLDKNLDVEFGKKLFYIQVIGPDANVVADKGAVNFGNTSLIYSFKKVINYRNEALDVKAQIKNKSTFKKGFYFINVFHKGTKVGSTKILLK